MATGIWSVSLLLAPGMYSAPVVVVARLRAPALHRHQVKLCFSSGHDIAHDEPWMMYYTI